MTKNVRVAVIMNMADSERFHFADPQFAYRNRGIYKFTHFFAQNLTQLLVDEILERIDCIVICSNAMSDPLAQSVLQDDRYSGALERALRRGMGLVIFSQVRFARSGGKLALVLPTLAGNLSFKVRHHNESPRQCRLFRHLRNTHSDALLTPHLLRKVMFYDGANSESALPGIYWCYLSDLGTCWTPLLSDSSSRVLSDSSSRERVLVAEHKQHGIRIIVAALLSDFQGLHSTVENFIQRVTRQSNNALVLAEESAASDGTSSVNRFFGQIPVYNLPTSRLQLRATVRATSYDNYIVQSPTHSSINRLFDDSDGPFRPFSVYYLKSATHTLAEIEFDNHTYETRLLARTLIAHAEKAASLGLIENNIWRTLFFIFDVSRSDRKVDLSTIKRGLIKSLHAYKGRPNYDEIFGQTTGLYIIRDLLGVEAELNKQTLAWLENNVSSGDRRDASVALMLASLIQSFDTSFLGTLTALVREEASRDGLDRNSMAFVVEALSGQTLAAGARYDELTQTIRDYVNAFGSSQPSTACCRVACAIIELTEAFGPEFALLDHVAFVEFCASRYRYARAEVSKWHDNFDYENLPTLGLYLRLQANFERVLGAAPAELERLLSFGQTIGGSAVSLVTKQLTRLLNESLDRASREDSLREEIVQSRRKTAVIQNSRAAIGWLLMFFVVTTYSVSMLLLESALSEKPASANLVIESLFNRAPVHGFAIAGMLAALAVPWDRVMHAIRGTSSKNE